MPNKIVVLPYTGTKRRQVAYYESAARWWLLFDGKPWDEPPYAHCAIEVLEELEWRRNKPPPPKDW